MSQQGRRRYPSTRGGIRPTLYSWNRKDRDRAERWDHRGDPSSGPSRTDGPDPGHDRRRRAGRPRCARVAHRGGPGDLGRGDGGRCRASHRHREEGTSRRRPVGCPHAPRRRTPGRARDQTREPRAPELIALSADDGGKEVDAMLRAGAGAYLVKGDGRQRRDRRSDPPLRPRPGWPDPLGRARAAVARGASVPESRAAEADRGRGRRRWDRCRLPADLRSAGRDAGRSRGAVPLPGGSAPIAGCLVRGGGRGRAGDRAGDRRLASGLPWAGQARRVDRHGCQRLSGDVLLIRSACIARGRCRPTGSSWRSPSTLRSPTTKCSRPRSIPCGNEGSGSPSTTRVRDSRACDTS